MHAGVMSLTAHFYLRHIHAAAAHPTVERPDPQTHKSRLLYMTYTISCLLHESCLYTRSSASSSAERCRRQEHVNYSGSLFGHGFLARFDTDVRGALRSSWYLSCLSLASVASISHVCFLDLARFDTDTRGALRSSWLYMCVMSDTRGALCSSLL